MASDAFFRAFFLSVVFIVTCFHGRSAVVAQIAPAQCFVGDDLAASLPNPSGVGGLVYTPGGELVVYGRSPGKVEMLTRPEAKELASFESTPFGSFLVLDSTEDSVLFGENSTGKIFSIPLSGEGGSREIDSISLNFDLVFDRAGHGLVSVLAETSQQIVLLDRDPDAANPVVVDNIPGFSGPLALDDDGNLYYGLSVFSGEPLTIHRFSPEQIDTAIGGTALDFSAGEEVADGIEGNFGMVWADGKLYYSDLGFGATGVGRIVSLDSNDGFTASEFARFTMDGGLVSPGHLAFRRGTKPFTCGHGPGGGTLAVSYSDFATVMNIAEIAPELHFVRGRVNADELVDSSDGIALLSHMFLGTDPPDPVVAGDINDDNQLDVSDPIFLFSFLFLGRDEPPPPFAVPGPDPTP